MPLHNEKFQGVFSLAIVDVRLKSATKIPNNKEVKLTLPEELTTLT
jgi:hypothetical protein